MQAKNSARESGRHPATTQTEMMTTVSPGVRFEDEEWESGSWHSQQKFKALTPEEARAVRRKNPLLSPWRVVRAQALAGAACVAIAWAFSRGEGPMWSALYGAAATVLPSALLARGMTRGISLGMQSPVASAAGFMFWEMLKIGVAIAMLVIASRVVPGLSWPALLATMAVCMKMNWFALLWRGR